MKSESGFSLAIGPNIALMISLEWCRGQRSVNLNWESFVTIFDLHPPSTHNTHNTVSTIFDLKPPTKPVLLLQILSLIDSDHRGGVPQFDISSGICQLSKQFSFEAAKCESGQIRRQKDVIWRGREDGNVRYYVISQISKLPVATFQATFGEDVKWVARRNVQNMTALGNTC